MAEPSAPSLLQRLSLGRRAVREPEPADLGTAFGLEQTVEDTEWAPPTPPATPERHGWWRRWSARGTSR